MVHSFSVALSICFFAPKVSAKILPCIVLFRGLIPVLLCFPVVLAVNLPSLFRFDSVVVNFMSQSFCCVQEEFRFSYARTVSRLFQIIQNVEQLFLVVVSTSSGYDNYVI